MKLLIGKQHKTARTNGLVKGVNVSHRFPLTKGTAQTAKALVVHVAKLPTDSLIAMYLRKRTPASATA